MFTNSNTPYLYYNNELTSKEKRNYSIIMSQILKNSEKIRFSSLDVRWEAKTELKES